MLESAFAAAMRPQSYASSTTGVKKSAVARPTSPSASAIPVRPRTISSSSPGGILHAQPPPCANWVSRTVSTPAVIPHPRRAYAVRPPEPAGPAMGTVGVEVSGHLVVPPVFNTGEAEYLGLAGSIPVHLRQFSAGEEVGVAQADPRRTVPRTDVLMAHPELVAAAARHGAAT